MKKVSLLFLTVAIFSFNGCGSSSTSKKTSLLEENNLSSEDSEQGASGVDSGPNEEVESDNNTTDENNTSTENNSSIEEAESSDAVVYSNSSGYGSSSGNSNGNGGSNSTNSNGDSGSNSTNSNGDSGSNSTNSNGDSGTNSTNSNGDSGSNSTNSNGDSGSNSTNSDDNSSSTDNTTSEDTNTTEESSDNSNSDTTSSSNTSTSTSSSSSSTSSSSTTTSSTSSTTTDSTDTDSTDSDSSIQGKAIDGELMSAFVFLDLDNDGIADSDEPNAITDKFGKYSFTLTSAQKKASKTGYAPIVVDGMEKTIDTGSGMRFRGRLKSPLNLQKPPVEEIYTTPITTVLAHTIESNVTATTDIDIDALITNAKSKVSQILGIDIDKLEANPIVEAEKGNSELMKLSLQIQKSIELTSEIVSTTENPYSFLYQSFTSTLIGLSSPINLDTIFIDMIDEIPTTTNDKTLIKEKVSTMVENTSKLFISDSFDITKLSIQFQTVVNYVSVADFSFNIDDILTMSEDDYTLEYNKNVLSPYIDVTQLSIEIINSFFDGGLADLDMLSEITADFDSFVSDLDIDIDEFKYDDIRTETKKTSSWDTGYCANVDVINSTSSDINWSVDMNITGKISSSWNVVITDKQEFSDTNTTIFKASGEDWNRVVKANDKVYFGYCAFYNIEENTTEVGDTNETAETNESVEAVDGTELTKVTIGNDASTVQSDGHFETIQKPVLVANSFDEIDDKLSNFYDVSVDIRNSNLVKDGEKDINVAVILNRLDNTSDAQLLAIVPLTLVKREESVVIVAKENSEVTLVARTGSGKLLTYSMINYSENVKTTTTSDGVKSFTIKAGTILNKFTQVSNHPAINQYIKDVIFNNLTTPHGYDVYVLFSDNTFDEDTPIILNKTDDVRDVSEIMGIDEDSDLDKEISEMMGTDLKGYWGEIDLVEE